MSKKINNRDESILEKFNVKYLLSGLLLILVIVLVIFYKPMAIDGMEPSGGDILKSMGQTNQIRNYQEDTKINTLWNPNVFVGIPTYFKKSNENFNFDTLIKLLNRWFLDWRVSWFLVGAIGMYLLLKTLGFPWFISIVGVVAFIFWPHFQGLIEVGHNAKVRAVCAMPIVVFGFLNYVKKRNVLSILWFTLLFSLQFRTKHYQIVFYTMLVLLAIGIYYIVIWIKDKEFARLGKTISIFLIGLVVSILMSAQPLFVAKEYTPFSTRGGTAINLKENIVDNSAKKSGGVSFDYATQWSFSPRELMTLVSPRFLGGTSSEKYNGKKYPQWKNQALPTYWGDLPFTQSIEYIGIIIVILAIFGVIINYKDGIVLTFSIVALFSLVLSFGHNFSPLYKLFFYHFPFFDKFRAPVMTLILTTFNVVVLAMYGLQSLLEILEKQKFKTFLIISGFFAVIGLLFVIAPNILSFSGAGDGRFASNPQVLTIIKEIRKEFMITDTLRMLFLLIVFCVLVVLLYLKKIKKEILILGVFLLVAFDSMDVSNRFIKNANYLNRKNAERRYFRKSQFDSIMEKEKDYYRVLEIGGGFGSNDLAYRHQIIGGYSAIKPQLIQDLVDNNLYQRPDPKVPFNFPLANMLNAKFIVAPGKIEHPGLEEVAINNQQRKVLYKNHQALPRAFFIGRTRKLNEEKTVLKYMNSKIFVPDSIAFFSNKILKEKKYCVDGNIKITDYTPNSIKIQTNTIAESFLILSEAYYPIGWKCLVNKKETTIYQMNHILRGIEIPAGEQEIEFNFEPASYKKARMISFISTNVVWLLLILFLIFNHKEKIINFINKKNK